MMPDQTRKATNEVSVPPQVFGPDDPCPCKSKKPVRLCCLDADGRLRIKVRNLLPPRPATGHSHPKCYLSSTRDCSSKISREHYISRSVLELIGSELQVGGLPWKSGAIAECGIDELASNVLCVRHNSALSPLDELAAKCFKTIRDVCDDVRRNFTFHKNTWHLVSGEALELWCMKTLCSLYFSRVAAIKGQALRRTHSFAFESFADAIYSRKVASNCGLYGRLVAGKFNRGLSWSPLSAENAERIIGVRIQMCAAEFEVILDPFNVNFRAVQRQMIYRPWNLVFSNGKRTHIVVLSWPDKPEGVRRINYTFQPNAPAQ